MLKELITKGFYFNSKRKLFLIIGLAFFYFSVSAQKQSQKFTHYGKQDGLNQSSVNFVYQDSNDYLWIANFGGINRFDGYNFTSYVNRFDDPSSISDNSVWTIIEDKYNTLWFGTKTGLSRYNRNTEDFTNYFIQQNEGSSGVLAVKALFEDNTGRLYVGSEGQGLFEFSTQNESFTRIEHIPNSAKVNAITEDVSGNLWVATENLGLFRISSNRSEVVSFIKTKAFTSKVLWSLYADEKGNVWIGTDTDGLVRYISDTNEFIFFKGTIGNSGYAAGDKIKAISEGHDGQIWIGSATKGLSYFSYATNRFYSYVKNPYDVNSLFDNDVSSIFKGSNRVLYVGFYMKGFDKVVTTPFLTIKNNPKDSNSLSNDNVYCMYLDNNEVLWFGTFGGGLNRYDIKTNRFEHYRYDKNDAKTISHDWIRIIYEDHNATMWIGTWGGGLNKFDKKTGVFKRYLPESDKKNSLNHNIITAIFEDADGELWIGTYGGGINIYQPETDDFRSIVHHKNDVNSLSDDHITSFYQGDDNLIWVCTYGGGLNAYDKKTGKFERFIADSEKEFSLNSHKTLHIFEEPNKDFFWITTLGGGINKFYYKEKKFLNYTESDGLSNNSTMGMLSAADKNYWISTNNGLSRFNPLQGSFTNYTTSDGLGSDDYNLEAYAKTKDGTLFFGGKKGITYFNPKNVVSTATFPKVAFTNIRIEDSIYKFVPSRIDVPYKYRITFQYAAINPDKTKNIKYAYQLMGQDKEWRDMGKNKFLEFTNLDPGNYELKIRSTNSDGVWNTDYTSVLLYIPPPWYMTWYFRIGMLLVVLITAYSYYKVKINQVKRTNRLLEKKVKKRTKTIQEKSIALKKEKDKTEEAYKQLQKLERFKDEFTSMLAHDLKNPLVTILGYSSENATDMNLQSINSSGKRMLNLIENMLEVQKFENTEVKVNLNDNNLKNLAIEAANQVEILAKEKRIQIITNIDSKYNVNVDEKVIERVFVNLLTNAIKFSDTDSKIEISTLDKKKRPDQIVLGIQDYGSGIPKHKLSSIFTKFSQVEARDSGDIRSTGLGLAFCRMAIEAHHGEIWVESEVNKGSTFFFSLSKLHDNMLHAEEKDDIMNYENPLHAIVLDAKDLNVLDLFSEKINTLTLYEMGEWLDLFDSLVKKETENIRTWKNMMMEALTNFDEYAFSYLKKIAVGKIVNEIDDNT